MSKARAVSGSGGGGGARPKGPGLPPPAAPTAWEASTSAEASSVNRNRPKDITCSLHAPPPFAHRPRAHLDEICLAAGRGGDLGALVAPRRRGILEQEDEQVQEIEIEADGRPHGIAGCWYRAEARGIEQDVAPEQQHTDAGNGQRTRCRPRKSLRKLARISTPEPHRKEPPRNGKSRSGKAAHSWSDR